MKDQTLTQSVWQSSLSGVEGNNATESIFLVLWAIKINFGQTWYAFLDLYEKFYRLLAAKDNPYDCDNCEDYCYPIYYNFQSIAEKPTDITVLRATPSSYGDVALDAVEVNYQPSQNQSWNFGNNVFGTLVIEYEPTNEQCSLGVKAIWSKGTLNSAIGKIWTYDGATWTERAQIPTNLNQNRFTPITLQWTNTNLEQWQKVRITVYTPQPRIHTFELFDLGA